jgi:heme-degrading monooxygenase HmoA
MTRITTYEVRPDEDQRFLAAWDASRAARGDAASVLHRAWRDDVAFRFVEVTRTRAGVSPFDEPAGGDAGEQSGGDEHEPARGDAGEQSGGDEHEPARGDAGEPAGSDAVARSGMYEVVHEDGAPDGSQGVVLVNPFEVPADADERFLAGWHVVHDVLATQRGYLGTRLYRSVEATVRFRFVNVARWSSPLMYSKALQQPAFEPAAAAVPFPAYPALYQVIRD